MNERIMKDSVRTGWGYWVIAVIGLLWNSFGCFDYYMTQTRNAAYLAQLPAEIITFLDAMPAWVHAAWAVGVWGSLLGSVLMLLRSRWAVAAFLLSGCGLVASQLHQWSVGMPASMTTPGMLVMQAVIWIVLLFLIWYTQRAQSRGVLR